MKIVKTATALALSLSLSLALGAGVTLAQQAPPAKPAGQAAAAGNAPRATAPGAEDNTTYKAKTVYDFEDDMVEGDLQRPDGELIDSVRKVKHSSLIEIRKDFIPEMLKSLEDL
jgi:hypothetical protein